MVTNAKICQEKKREFQKSFVYKTAITPPTHPHQCRARRAAHRGGYVNTVLPVVQEGEYIARRVGRTHGAVGQQLEARPTVGRGDGGLQSEGSKVEKQSQEMVKDILRREGREETRNYFII